MMNQQEFTQLTARLRPRIVAQSLKITGSADSAEDIAQDTFLRLWQLRDTLYRYKSVDALAVVMARNLAIDHLRNSGRTTALDDVVAFTADVVRSADEAIIASEVSREVNDILGRLAPAQQAVMRMRHIDEMEIADIAKVIGATENNVRVLLCRARARVKELFLNNQI